MTTYWKQFAGWVTDLRNRYWHDVFFRTEFNVIVLQIVFASVISIVVAVSFNYLYKDILTTVVNDIIENIKANGSITGQDIFDSVQVLKAKNFLGFFSVTVIITLIFSWLIAKVTLTPARNALRSQKRFISDIAHEIRTPLSVIKTNSEVALLDDSLKPDVRRVFKSNIEELDRTSSIINNLLSFNNLIRPEQIQFVQVDLGKVVDTVVKKLVGLSKNKDITIVVKKVDPCAVWGNTVALEQITSNILRNSIKYTNDGGRIIIQVKPDYIGNVLLSVEDTGMGISQADLLHIFEPFYRAEKSRNKKSGGSGLGLTIVSELVKLHGGKVTVKSSVGKGTIVTISLPHSNIDSNDGKQTDEHRNEISIDFMDHPHKE